MIEQEFCINGTQGVKNTYYIDEYNCSQTFKKEDIIFNISNVMEGEYYSIDLVWYTLPMYTYTEKLYFGMSKMLTITILYTCCHAFYVGTFQVTEVEVSVNQNDNTICVICTMSPDDTMSAGCIALLRERKTNDEVIIVINKPLAVNTNTFYDCANGLSAGIYSVYVTDLSLFQQYHFDKIAFKFENCCSISKADSYYSGHGILASGYLPHII